MLRDAPRSLGRVSANAAKSRVADPHCNENTSPNGANSSSNCDDELNIKAWRAKNRESSGIPRSPAVRAEALDVTPRRKTAGTEANVEDQTTPDSVTRERRLEEIRETLQFRLDTERKAQIEAVKALEGLPPGDEKLSELNEEVNSRGAKIMVLSQKLTRTQHTLGSLQKATDDYQSSAKKVKDAQSKIVRRSSSGLKLSSKESSSLRKELDAATSMMNAACQRVEQIESITDALIKQLSETELELAELQDARNSDLVKHSAEVERLAHERDCLALQLAASDSASKELMKKENDLSKRLTDAKSNESRLSEELKQAGKARAVAEEQMKMEKAKLTQAIKDLEKRQKELQESLEEKDTKLKDALDLAKQGTPRGKGAKEVLPMALQKLKNTQQELGTMKEEREKAIKDLEYEKQLAQAREDAIRDQLENHQQESEHHLQEKQASLESMMRAAAAAAKEAAIKQDTINTLTSEIAKIEQEKEGVAENLEESKGEVRALQSQLQDAKKISAQMMQKITDLTHSINKQKSLVLEQEIILKTQTDELEMMNAQHSTETAELKKRVELLTESKAKNETSLCSKEAIIARLKSEIHASETRISEMECSLNEERDAHERARAGYKADRMALMDTLNSVKSELDEKRKHLSAANQSKNSLNVTIQEKELEISKLSETYEDAQKASEKVLLQREQCLETTRKELQKLEEKYLSTCSELKEQKDIMEISSRETDSEIKRLVKELREAEVGQQDLIAKLSELEQTSERKQTEAYQEIKNLKLELEQTRKIKASLETSHEADKRKLHTELQHLQDLCDNLERVNSRLNGQVDNLGKELCIKNDAIEEAKSHGTPKGEAAKVILSKAFEKVRGLQGNIVNLEEKLSEKDEILRVKSTNIENLESNIMEMKLQADSLNNQVVQKTMEVESSQERCHRLEEEISKIATKLDSEYQAKIELQNSLFQKDEKYAVDMNLASERVKVLEAKKRDYEQQTKSLRLQLSETKQVLCNLRSSEDASQELIRVSFLKIQGFEKSLRSKNDVIDKIQKDLEDALSDSAILRKQLEEGNQIHQEELASKDSEIKFLEGNLSRLRIELVTESDKRETIVKELSTAKQENDRLRAACSSLEDSIQEGNTRYNDVSNALKSVEAQLEQVCKERQVSLAAFESHIRDVRKEKEVALQASAAAAARLQKLETEVMHANKNLKNYESTLEKKEHAIRDQEMLIKELSGKSESLSRKIAEADNVVAQRDERIRRLLQNKLSVEAKLEEEIENLKMKIAEDKENANKQNLAEIAAQQSARILEETKTRLQQSESILQSIQADKDEAVRTMQSLEAQLKTKSRLIEDLLDKINAQEEMRKDMESIFSEKQTELESALRSAEWLVSSTKARHQSTVDALNTKIDSLEKRCQFMDILERQNVELCAQLRDLHNSKKSVVSPTQSHNPLCEEQAVNGVQATRKDNGGPESFQVIHVEDITSPHPTQRNGGNRTVAAISVAALSVMALGLAARADTSRLS